MDWIVLIGHAAIVVAYLLMAHTLYGLGALARKSGGPVLARLFNLLVCMMLACAAHHLLNFVLMWCEDWPHHALDWVFAASLWLTSFCTFYALGFVWRLRPPVYGADYGRR